MKCNTCRGKTRVSYSIPIKNGAIVKRRRICKTCGRRFTTHECPVERTVTWNKI